MLMLRLKAPLITLFGERLTKQFLSESISTLDNVIFALSPLGVLTSVVSVIRICGSSSLRAFVGRAQEGPAEAESELLPCVSESTAELFNDGGITRVFGRPKIVEIVAWEDVDPRTGKMGTNIGTLKDALEEKAWSCNSKHPPSEIPELHIPNLSLNKGIKRRDQFWFHCAAILGGILQSGRYFSFFELKMILTIPPRHCYVRYTHGVCISAAFPERRQSCCLIRISVLYRRDNPSVYRDVLLRIHHGAFLQGVLSQSRKAKQDILVAAW